ncbi:MAG TPA: NUDIX hydrolase [Patescibacteria group bacterium]|nr:NUDIX hydrolase [Patescibacteria group bacterium]
MPHDLFHLGIKALIQNAEGKILLLRVNPAELKKFSGEPYWDIPGGRIHQGESIEGALKREVFEETGLTVTSLESFIMVLSPIRIPVEKGTVGLVLSIYLCSVAHSDSVVISPEHTEARWFNPIEAARLLEIKYPKEFTEKLERAVPAPSSAGRK